MVSQVLVEESVLGWEELEVEVVRDAKDQMISVCFIENVDPMGVHTGDSYCNAPMQTISDELTARLQDIAHRIVSSIGVIGGTNVQTAHDPVSDRIVVIEINPRTSRSSALVRLGAARGRTDPRRAAVLAGRLAREVHARR
jgi:carbamoyl-phosphate synthase large subunit